MRQSSLREVGLNCTRTELVLLGAMALLSTGQPVLESQSAPKTLSAASAPVIRTMRAQLFLNKKGAWSNDVLAAGAADLRNSGAGPDASNTTLVVVEVGGQAGANYTGSLGTGTKYSVRLVAREGRDKTLLDQTQRIPVLDARGTVHLPFLLRQGGCSAVVLRASIVGAVASKPVERTLTFTCGE
jgi:hypothetical protein